MSRAFRSEWIKIRRRSVLLAGGAMTFFTVVGVYFSITRATAAGKPSPEFSVAHLQATDGLTFLLQRGSQIVAVIGLILVAAAIAAEYSQGTLRNLLVREPGRLRFLAGKFAALLVFALLAATVALAVGVGVAFAVAPSHGLTTTAWTSSTGLSNLLSFYGNLLIAVTAYAVLGAFAAVVFRSAAAAVGVAIAYALAVEALISNVWVNAPQWLYGRNTNNVLIGGDPTLSTYQRSLVVLGVYAVVMIAVGAILFRARDVSS